MIIYGSIKHTYSGKKKKPRKSASNNKPNYKWETLKMERSDYLRETPNYPSFKGELVPLTHTDNAYKKEISKGYTISVAYNKGAYQVISDENIKDIGK